MNFKDKVLKYGSFFLVFLSPLIFWSHGLFPHISSKTFFIYGVVEILFAVWIYTIIVDKSYRLSKRILIWFTPLISFVLWMTIAGVFAVNPSLSLWSSLGRGTGLLTLYHSIAMALVVASLVKKDGLPYIISLFQGFIASSFFLAISVWLGSDGFSLSAKVLKTDIGGGFGGNSTLTAGYFLFTLAMSLFLLNVKSLSFRNKLFIWITIAVTIFSPVFINIYGFLNGRGILGTARGTLLALFTGLLMVGISYMFFSSKKWIKNTSIVIVVLGLISFGLLWSQLITPDTYLHQKFSEEARGSRFIFWDIANTAMHKHPFLGYGPENYFMAFEENFNPQILLLTNSSEGFADRAHNIYYDLGVSGGYPVVLLYVLFFASLFYGVYKLYKNEKLSRTQSSIIIGLLVSHITNLLFTFESNISILALFILSGIIYALLDNNEDKNLSHVDIDKYYRVIIISVLIIILVISEIFFVYMPITKSARYAETFAAPLNQRPSLYPELLKGSTVGSHWDISGLTFYVYRLYTSNPAQSKKDKENLPYQIKDLEALTNYLYKVSEFNKTDYRLYITIAFLENMLTYLSDRPFSNEVRDRVLNVLEKAKSLSPTNPNVYWGMAQVKVWQGDLAGAEEVYRQAINVAPHFPASYDLFLKYAIIVRSQKIYNEIMIKAKENIPGYELK